jgi:hypothetical protein
MVSIGGINKRIVALSLIGGRSPSAMNADAT